MEFRIADTFTESLGRLTGEEQKAVKTTAFDLQLNPANPGMKLHKLDKAKDKNFWSVRVNSDVRLIVHQVPGSLLLCYVDHHDKAYQWVRCRKLQTHPKTGAAQLVELRETVQEILVPTFVTGDVTVEQPIHPATAKRLFAHVSEDDLYGYGVPAEWLADVQLATETTLLTLAEHLPAEAAEALLELATGGTPRVTQPVNASVSPFDHPDAQRRFRVMTNVDELRQALDFPWETWTVFLHPDQHQLVEKNHNGPARVSGSAGTGKTIVALHRAAYLARTNPASQILLTTFSDTLASALRTKLSRLLSHQIPLHKRIEVCSLNRIGLRLYKQHVGPVSLADSEMIDRLLSAASAAVPAHKFNTHFLLTEWKQVVDAWQLGTWESYRDVARLGRKTRLPENQRKVLWSIYERVHAGLKSQNLTTSAGLFTTLATVLTGMKNPPFGFAVVDEAQDLSVAQLRFFAALGATRSNALFFAGDLGQRIFQEQFSWKSLGVDIRGRSKTLRVNYRTSHQIRAQADRLLDGDVSDVDGNCEERRGTISVFNGPDPTIQILKSEREEIKTVSHWLAQQAKNGTVADEMGLFVRSAGELHRAIAAAKGAGLAYSLLDEQVETSGGQVSICTMHLAKGLEFRAVAVMACDDEVIPLQERIETVGDDADLREVYETERHLLYVACTRARDHLLVTGVKPASEFLDDLIGQHLKGR
jgi:superfamily I DNA/RNA helicase